MSKVILDKTMDSPVFEHNEHTIEFAVKDDVYPTKWGFYSDGDFVELSPSAPPKLPNNIVLGTPRYYSASGYYSGANTPTAQINVTLTKGVYIFATEVGYHFGTTVSVGQVTRKVVSGTVNNLTGSGSGGPASSEGKALYSADYCGSIQVVSDSATMQYYTTNPDGNTCSNQHAVCVSVIIIPVTFKDPE